MNRRSWLRSIALTLRSRSPRASARRRPPIRTRRGATSARCCSRIARSRTARASSIWPPQRAHDAAIVPIEIVAEIPQTPERHIRTVHLVIDQNPAPVAGVFHLSPRAAAPARHAGAHQRIHQRPRHRRDQRRPAVHGQPVREGIGRLLGAGAQGPRAGDGPPRPDEDQGADAVPAGFTQRGPAADQPSQLFRHADGPAQPPLDPAALRARDPRQLRRPRDSAGGRRHLAEREPLDPLLLRAGGPGELSVRVVDSAEQEFSARLALGGAARS